MPSLFLQHQEQSLNRLRSLYGDESGYYHPAQSWTEFCDLCQDEWSQLAPLHQELVPAWLDIGHRNPWIKDAIDPPFTLLSLLICQDVRHLAERFLHGNWCLGSAFALDDICFINQVDGGGEYLTIKGRTPFESITIPTFHETREQTEERVCRTVERIQRATEEQCRRLKY